MSSVISPVLRTTSIIGWGSIIIIQKSMLVVTTNPSSLPSRARCAWWQTWMQHFHCPFKQAQHFEINRDTFLAYNLLRLPTNDEKHKSRFMRCYLFSSLFSETDSKCEFKAASCLLKPHGGKVWRNFYLAARVLACLSMCRDHILFACQVGIKKEVCCCERYFTKNGLEFCAEVRGVTERVERIDWQQ